MSAPLSRMLTLALAVLLVGTAATASARPKKHRAPQQSAAQPSAARTSTGIVNCDGTPIIMVGIECKKRPVAREEQATQPAEEQATKPVVRPRITSRGSGGIYAPARLTPPSVPLAQPSTGVYIPPRGRHHRGTPRSGAAKPALVLDETGDLVDALAGAQIAEDERPRAAHALGVALHPRQRSADVGPARRFRPGHVHRRARSRRGENVHSRALSWTARRGRRSLNIEIRLPS